MILRASTTALWPGTTRGCQFVTFVLGEKPTTCSRFYYQSKIGGLQGYIKIPIHNLLAVIPKKKYGSIWHSSSTFGTNGHTCVARSVALTKSSADRRGSAGAPMRGPGILWCYRIAHFMPWIPMNSQEIHMSNGWNPFFPPISARWGHSK